VVLLKLLRREGIVSLIVVSTLVVTASSASAWVWFQGDWGVFNHDFDPILHGIPAWAIDAEIWAHNEGDEFDTGIIWQVTHQTIMLYPTFEDDTITWIVDYSVVAEGYQPDPPLGPYWKVEAFAEAYLFFWNSGWQLVDQDCVGVWSFCTTYPDPIPMEDDGWFYLGHPSYGPNKDGDMWKLQLKVWNVVWEDPSTHYSSGYQSSEVVYTVRV
jgi:hypothetical protein